MTQSTTQAISSACSRLVRNTVVREEAAANSSALANSRSSDATARPSAALPAGGVAEIFSSVMSGCSARERASVPAIGVFGMAGEQVVAARADKPAHDDRECPKSFAARSLNRLGCDVL